MGTHWQAEQQKMDHCCGYEDAEVWAAFLLALEEAHVLRDAHSSLANAAAMKMLEIGCHFIWFPGGS